MVNNNKKIEFFEIKLIKMYLLFLKISSICIL